MKCIICNKEIKESSYTHKILCSQKCFIKDFWDEKVKWENDPTFKHKIVRINGEHYIQRGISNLPNKNLGFGGRVFKIKFFDDETIIETNNLWYQGVIPVEYKELLKDNAEFIKIGEN